MLACPLPMIKQTLVGLMLLALGFFATPNTAQAAPDGLVDAWTADNGVVPVIQTLSESYLPDGSLQVTLCVTGVGRWAVYATSYSDNIVCTMASGMCSPVANPIVHIVTIPASMMPLRCVWLSVYNVRGWPAWMSL